MHINLGRRSTACSGSDFQVKDLAAADPKEEKEVIIFIESAREAAGPVAVLPTVSEASTPSSPGGRKLRAQRKLSWTDEEGAGALVEVRTVYRLGPPKSDAHYYLERLNLILTSTQGRVYVLRIYVLVILSPS